MKVTFVYPDLSKMSQGKFYHGTAFLSAVLKQAGHATSLIHLYRPFSHEEFVNAVSKAKPDMVAFSATSNMFDTARHYAKIVKDNFSLPVLFGGIHTTIVPEEVILCNDIDMICVGEGEHAIVELCNRMDRGEDINGIPGIWTKKDGTIYRNSPGSFIQNLDKLPFPDRSIYDHNILEDTRLNRAVFMASRGCPYSCSYCCNHELRGVSTGTYVRFRSVDNIISEIEAVVKEHPVTLVSFHDDILTIRKDWLREFSQKYRKEIATPFVCNSRVNLLDRDVIALLKDAGCQGISMGVESGNDETRKMILQRNITRTQIINAFSLCREYGIAAGSYNMVGLPFETMEKILETIRLNARIKPTSLQVSIFYPYPGTKIYNVCKVNNFLTHAQASSYFESTTLNQTSISASQVKFTFHNFETMVAIYSCINTLSGKLRYFSEMQVGRLFISSSPIITAITALLGSYKDIRYYLLAIRTTYQEHGALHVVNKIIKKIFKPS